jgi:predicted DNA-binding transcriptional regulator AlpA
MPHIQMPVRGLRASEAARYMGMSESKFLEMVSEGRLSSGFKVDRMTLWDVRDLDSAFDELKDCGRPKAALDNSWSGVAP